MRRLLLLMTAAAATLALSSPPVNHACMSLEPLRPAENASNYYECAALSDEEISGYHLSERYLGVWKLRDCPSGAEFDEGRQRCSDRKTLRRQQASCGSNPASTACARPCSITTSSASAGSACNWMTSSLQADPASNAYFLQCAQTQQGPSCGVWQRQPCAAGTVFQAATGICTPLAARSACSPSSSPVCSCASVNSACPGVATCQQSVCCQPTSTSSSFSPQAQQPRICPGSNVEPLGPCSQPCPQYSACMPNIGCCPVPVINQQPTVPVQINLCPGSLSPPVGTCGMCPTNTQCNAQMGRCCPMNRQPSTDIVYNVVLLCPNGSPANQACGTNNACPSDNGCYNGACCPMQCPQGQTALGFCGQTSTCAQSNAQCYKPAGCCCQAETIRLPVCANGQSAKRRCSVDAECGLNEECSNMGCCPMPFCPTGVQAISRCHTTNACMPGQQCLEGLCCALPKCPNGIVSLGTCTRSLDCGRPGVECANGACCPLPTCGNGVIAIQRCTSTCPSGSACSNGGCCPLPACPTGGMALSGCGAKGCGRGMECFSGGCCPLPLCPSGLVPTQRCRTGVVCPNGNMCENGVCCPMPQCSNSQIAVSVCGVGNACPIGYVCEGRGCCPEPMPLCPNGGRASSRCNRGAECPPGHGCTALGGCCLLSMEPVCPAKTSAICQCSPNQGCPNGASCTMGTCCAPKVSSYSLVPGTKCQMSNQCNGASGGSAQCVRSLCVCANGASSNGAACLKTNAMVRTMARNGCDQYGSPCKFVFSTARRRPIFAPIGNTTEQPLFFNVASERGCVSDDASIDADATCLPNEKCIDGRCRMRLWPGEYGCESDVECSSRCPNTYCEAKKSDKSVAQCQCTNGMLLYGRCFSQCPRGFHESGAYCMHDDEDAFWSDGEAQNSLRELLKAGKC